VVTKSQHKRTDVDKLMSLSRSRSTDAEVDVIGPIGRARNMSSRETCC
jgi:hypothetical protein